MPIKTIWLSEEHKIVIRWDEEAFRITKGCPASCFITPRSIRSSEVWKSQNMQKVGRFRLALLKQRRRRSLIWKSRSRGVGHWSPRRIIGLMRQIISKNRLIDFQAEFDARKGKWLQSKLSEWDALKRRGIGRRKAEYFNPWGWIWNFLWLMN